MARRRNELAKQAVGAAVVVLGAAAMGGAAGCLQILGDEGPFVLGTGGGGTGGAGASGGSGGTGGTGGTMVACEPGTEEACYEGPDGTLGEGVCMGGMRTCAQDGIWGACSGQVLPGVETCASKDDEDCDKKECARWSLISGGDGGAIGTALATDSQGNVIVAGFFEKKISFGDQMLDGATNGNHFLVKLDSTGSAVWAESFGGFDLPFSVIRSVVSDESGNLLVAGGFVGTLKLGGSAQVSKAQDFFIAKFTSSGVPAFLRSYGGDAEQDIWGAVLDSSGDILVTGEFGNGFLIGTTSNSGSGVFVARLSASDGDVMSVTSFDPLVGDNVSPQVTAGADGSWVLSGRCSDGAVIGGKALTPCENFVAKFGADDSLLWAVNTPNVARAITVASDGSVVFAGDFNNPADFGQGPLTSKGLSDVFVAKLAAADGAIQWAKSFGGSGDDLVPTLTIDSQDRLYLALDADDDIDFGGGTLSGAGLKDSFLAALDSEGNHRWSRVFGDATDQAGTRLAVRAGDVGLVVSVNSPGEVDFGAGPLLSTSGYGLAVAELGP